MPFSRLKADHPLINALQAAGVDLQRRGGLLWGRCPFHEEKTGSFAVYPDGHYHCHGCHVHGDVIDWTMHQQGISKREAIHLLAGPGWKPKRVRKPPDPTHALRRQYRRQFAALVEKLRLVLTQLANAIRGIHLPANGVVSERVWDKLATAYERKEAVEREVMAFWEQPGLADWEWWWSRQAKCTQAEMWAHCLRPRFDPDTPRDPLFARYEWDVNVNGDRML